MPRLFLAFLSLSLSDISHIFQKIIGGTRVEQFLRKEFIHFQDPQPRTKSIHQRANNIDSLYKNLNFPIIYWLTRFTCRKIIIDHVKVCRSDASTSSTYQRGREAKERCVDDVNEKYVTYVHMCT